MSLWRKTCYVPLEDTIFWPLVHLSAKASCCHHQSDYFDLKTFFIRALFLRESFNLRCWWSEGGGGGKVVGLIGTNVGQEELKIGLKIATAHLHKTSNRDNFFEKLRRQIDRLPGFPFSNLLKACKAELNLYFPRACSNFDLQRQVFKCPRGGEMRDIEKNYEDLLWITQF